MNPMADPGKSLELMSLAGPLRLILVPEALGIDDPKELGRAMAAWRYDLSHEEIRLIELLALGLTDIEIAARMGGVEVNTIKNRLRRLYNKVDTHNRTRLAMIAAIYGFAEQPPPPHHSNG